MTGSLVRDWLSTRTIALASLVLLAALAWLYLWLESAGMDGMSMTGTMPMAASPRDYALSFLMWAIMMAGMMLPSAMPAVLLYESMVRKNAARGVTIGATWAFVTGYLLVWSAFSAVVSVAQLQLQQRGWLTAGMSSGSVWLSSGVFIAAGIYQWLPVKSACLTHCREPLQMFLAYWRSGLLGSLRMGMMHGRYCVGCCWVLMLLLFVGGVMNLLWVALIAAFVLIEKAVPAPRATSALAGVVLIGVGIGIALFA